LKALTIAMRPFQKKFRLHLLLLWHLCMAIDENGNHNQANKKSAETLEVHRE
jgi:hypothetical protein